MLFLSEVPKVDSSLGVENITHIGVSIVGNHHPAYLHVNHPHVILKGGRAKEIPADLRPIKTGLPQKSKTELNNRGLRHTFSPKFS